MCDVTSDLWCGGWSMRQTSSVARQLPSHSIHDRRRRRGRLSPASLHQDFLASCVRFHFLTFYINLLPCWKRSPDIWRWHSMSSALCWLIHTGGTVHQTFNTRWPYLPSGFGMCVEQPAVICVWNSLSSSVRNAPSLTTFRRELKTVLFQSSFDNDWAIVIVLHSITVVCPRLPTVDTSVFFV